MNIRRFQTNSLIDRLDHPFGRVKRDKSHMDNIQMRNISHYYTVYARRSFGELITQIKKQADKK